MDALEETFRHHAWATGRLISHLRSLPEEALTVTAPGVYGSPIETVCHILAADDRLLRNVEGEPTQLRPGPEPMRSLDELEEAARDQAARWQAVLPRLPEIDVTLASRPGRPPLEHASNLVVGQALQHGNEHRAQVCVVLSANGYEAPSLDMFNYWRDRLAAAVLSAER